MTVSAELEIQTPTSTLPKAVLKKKEPTPAEALAILEHYENELKETARIRTLAFGDEKLDYEQKLYNRLSIKVGAFSAITMVFSTFGGLIFNLGEPAMITSVASLTPLLAMVFAPNTMDRTFSKLASPRMSKKWAAENLINTQLHEMLQEDFAAVEEKILKKVNNAVRVINKSLAAKGRELQYCSEIGNEGFIVVEKEELKTCTKWQKVGALVLDDYAEVRAITAKPQKSKKEISR